MARKSEVDGWIASRISASRGSAMSDIRKKLETHRSPRSSRRQTWQTAMGVEYGTLYHRIRKLKPEEHPENYGMFLAGGVRVFVNDSGVRWADRHLAYWATTRGDKDAI